jgi:predicted dinucleotide-binding enzyme
MRREKTVFTCADDKAARPTVIALAKEIGFEGVNAGHLDASLIIENLGLLVGQLAYGSGFGDRASLSAYVMPGLMPGDFERN